MDDFTHTLSSDTWVLGVLRLRHVEWKFTLETAPGPRQESGHSLDGEHGVEGLEEDLDLAVSVQSGEQGDEILAGEDNLWSFLGKKDEPPELEKRV